MTNSMSKGFTLVELLVVIGILAILATATVLVVNPAQLLAQSRDASRIADLDTVNSALAQYVSQCCIAGQTLSLGTGPAGGKCTVAQGAGAGPFGAPADTCAAGTRAVSGAGWVDVDFTDMPDGSPLGVLPVDPKNPDAAYPYGYRGITASSTWELAAKLESTKHAARMTNDGGDDAAWYEIGNNPGLSW